MKASRDVKTGRWKTVGLTLLVAAVLSACAGLGFPLEEATQTPEPTPTQTLTPTATIVWFPPTSTPTLFPTQAAQPTPESSVEAGPLILEDDFSDTSLWQTRQSEQGSIAYGVDELSLAIPGAKTTLVSLRSDLTLNDFYLEMDVSPTLCHGTDQYGLLLRAQSEEDFYRWIITCEGQMRLERVKAGTPAVMQNWIGGASQPGSTRLGVWASGREMNFYVNGAYQFTVRDPVFPGGSLGVFSRSSGEKALTVSFSNLKVYALPGED
jgi:hypothetical protein